MNCESNLKMRVKDVKQNLVLLVNNVKHKISKKLEYFSKKVEKGLNKDKQASTFSSKKRKDKDNISLSEEQKEIIVGLLLADAYLERKKISHNTRLRIDHTYPNQEKYVEHLYKKFQTLSGKPPKIYIRNPDKRTGKVYKSISFKTFNLPCLNYYHSLFYKQITTLTEKISNNKAKFIKIVPNDIEALLTPISLAH